MMKLKRPYAVYGISALALMLFAIASREGYMFKASTRPSSPQETSQSGAPKQKTSDSGAPKVEMLRPRKTEMVDPYLWRRNKDLRPASQARIRAAQWLIEGNIEAAESAARETIRLAEGKSELLPKEGRRLMGQIRMRQRKYFEALEWLQGDYEKGQDMSVDLDIALSYVRLGRLENARQYFSEDMIIRYSGLLRPEDLPGTGSLRNLELSILLARGQNQRLRGNNREAIRDLQEAFRIAPMNAVVAYSYGKSLVHLGQTDEAMKKFRVAVELGNDRIAGAAKGAMRDIGKTVSLPK